MDKRVWNALARKLEAKPLTDEERAQAKRHEAEGGNYSLRMAS